MFVPPPPPAYLLKPTSTDCFLVCSLFCFASAGTTVGPGGYFLNFTAYGLQINGGHEVMMHLCWLGETNFDYPFSPTDLPTATAIQINGGGGAGIALMDFRTSTVYGAR